MSALDPVVSARSAYLPTGPREEYRGERPVYRRDEGPRGGSTPGGVQASIPARPAMPAVTANQMSAEKCEPAQAPSPEPSTSQVASTAQPSTSTSTNPETHLPLAALSVGAGEPSQAIGEEHDEGEKPCVPDFNPARLAQMPKKERIVEAVRQGHGSYAEISAATGLTKSEVSAVIHATLILATKSRPAVLVESTPPEQRCGPMEAHMPIDYLPLPPPPWPSPPLIPYGAAHFRTPPRHTTRNSGRYPCLQP